MLKNTNCKQLDIFTETSYHRIPKKHILLKINSAISLQFVNRLLAQSYCANFGRPAYSPEQMVRILIVQKLYNLSDENVMDEIAVNRAMEWFCGFSPIDNLPHPSTLCKFRTLRLLNMSVDEIMTEIVRQCIDRKLIESDNGVAIDTTHIEANCVKKVPERIMSELTKRIFRERQKECPALPDWENTEDHQSAKQQLKEILEDAVQTALVKTKSVCEAEEVLSDPMFIAQKGVRSLQDKDARVGNKTKEKQFFGYKAEFIMTTKSKIITAVTVQPGNYRDGNEANALIEQTMKSGLEPKHFCGDKSYFRPDILNKLDEIHAVPYIPVSACSYRINEERFAYQKDSDQWICCMGNESISKKHIRTGRGPAYQYTFQKEQCRNCPLRKECIGTAGGIAKRLHVGLHTSELYEYSQWTKTKAFLDGYRLRAAIEPKNAELKRFHGLARAKGYGLKSVTLQAKLTALAVNLKRIVKLLNEKQKETASIYCTILQKAISFFNFLFQICKQATLICERSPTCSFYPFFFSGLEQPCSGERTHIRNENFVV